MTDQWGRPLMGDECKALMLPGGTPVLFADGSIEPGDIRIASEMGFNAGDALYQLPANSAAYIVADWNRDHPDQPPFRYWAGDEEEPWDWDGGEVLLRSGGRLEGRAIWRTHTTWKHAYLGGDIIGYHTRIPAESANCPGVGEAWKPTRCPACLSSTFSDVHGADMVRCVECKRVYERTGDTFEIRREVGIHPEGSDVADLLERLRAEEYYTDSENATLRNPDGPEAASLIERMEGTCKENLQVGGWRPIEMAPKDGTRIIVWSPVWQGSAVGAKWNDDRYSKKPRPYWQTDDVRVRGVDACRSIAPEWWQPLPTQPAIDKLQTRGGSDASNQLQKENDNG